MRALVLLVLCAAAAWSATIEEVFESPAGSITGLAFGEGYLWALDHDTKTVFRLDPESGAVAASMPVSYIGAYECFGLAMSNDTLYVSWLKYGGPDSYYVRHDAWTGATLGVVSLC